MRIEDRDPRRELFRRYALIAVGMFALVCGISALPVAYLDVAAEPPQHGVAEVKQPQTRQTPIVAFINVNVVGKTADLILVEGNPLKDVANASRRAGVMTRGRWFTEEELRKMLNEMAASYAPK